jgi:serine/threonine protein kinase
MDLQRCGDYILTELLNEGGTAQAFLARSPDNKNVVIRKLHSKYKLRYFKRKEFARGLEIQSKMNHPNIVKVIQQSQQDLIPYAVLEYVDGVNLRHAIANKSYFTDNPILILKQILNGVSHIHQQGYLHLDLKPENILISRHGEVKVMDFDLAEPILEKPRAHSKINGTLNYLAPEQILRKPIDERADIFSLGIVMFELFTGQKPFVAMKKNEALEVYADLDRPFTSPRAIKSDLPPGIDRIIMNCIQKRADLRYPTVSMIVHELHDTKGVS